MTNNWKIIIISLICLIEQTKATLKFNVDYPLIFPKEIISLKTLNNKTMLVHYKNHSIIRYSSTYQF